MRVSKEKAYKLMLPWRTMDRAPIDDDVLGAVAAALAEACEDEAHCKRVVSEIETGSRFPSTQDIRRVAWEVRPHQEKGLVGCAKCGHTGFIYTQRLIQRKVRQSDRIDRDEGVRYDFSSPCPACHPAAGSRSEAAKVS